MSVKTDGCRIEIDKILNGIEMKIINLTEYEITQIFKALDRAQDVYYDAGNEQMYEAVRALMLSLPERIKNEDKINFPSPLEN